jgi:hypothetical protein
MTRREQVEDLLDRAELLSPSRTQVELHEEAVRIADLSGELDLSFRARQALVESATHSGYPEKAMLAFSWLLAQHDRHPERFDEGKLLWYYKWVAADLAFFPQISRAQIEEAFADMERRYRAAGLSLRPVHKLRWVTAIRMGDPDLAHEEHARWELAPADRGTDCAACEQDDTVMFHVFSEDLEAALCAAAPIVEGRMSCASVPEVTLATLLLPLLRLGRPAEALRHHRRGYPLVADNRTFCSAVSEHLQALVLTDNLTAAARLVDRHLAWAIEVQDLNDRFRIYLACRLLTDRLAQRGDSAPAFRAPRTCPVAADGLTEPATLGAWLDGELTNLAARFDQRNGTTRYADELAANQELLTEVLTPHPLD